MERQCKKGSISEMPLTSQQTLTYPLMPAGIIARRANAGLRNDAHPRLPASTDLQIHAARGVDSVLSVNRVGGLILSAHFVVRASVEFR